MAKRKKAPMPKWDTPTAAGLRGNSESALRTGGRTACWPYAGAAAITLAGFAPFLPSIGSRLLGSAMTDMNLQYRHFIAFAVRWLREGVVPHWNPHTFCGGPFLLNTSTTVLSPLSGPLLVALPQPLSINLVIILHTVLFACFTVFWARMRGLSPLAAFVAGALAGCCSAIPCRIFAGHLTIVTTLALMPLLLGVQEGMFRGRIRGPIPLGIVAALVFAGGHLQYVYYTALFAGANLLLFGIENRRQGNGTGFGKLLAYHGIAAGIVCGLVAVEAIPVLDALRYSARGGVKDPEWIRFFSMPFENYLSLLGPGFLGSGVEYFGRWYWWETTAYIGMTGLALVAAGCAGQLLEARGLRLPLLMFVGVLLASVGYIPGLEKAMWYLPGWSTFRGHAKILGPTMVVAALLAGHGLDALVARSKAAVCAAMGAAVMLTAGSLILWAVGTPHFMRSFLSDAARLEQRMTSLDLLNPAVMQQATGAWRGAFGLGFLWAAMATAGMAAAAVSRNPRMAALIAGLAVVDPLIAAFPFFGTSFTPERDTTGEAVVDFLQSRNERARIDMIGRYHFSEGMTPGFEVVGGHDISVTTYFDSFACALQEEPKGQPHMNFWLTQESLDSPLLDAANLKYFVPIRELPAEALQQLNLRAVGSAAESTVYERTTALPRAYTIGAAQSVTGTEDDLIAALIARSEFRSSVLLTGLDPVRKSSANGAIVPAKVEYDGLTRVVVRPGGDGWLVLCDGFSPRWRATKNGEPAAILRANGMFRAVADVKLGDEVEFRLQTLPFQAGAAVTGLTVLGLMLYGAWCAIRGRQRSEPVKSPA